MTTILHLMAFLFCTGSAFFVWKLALLAKNKCFWVIVAALMYASCLRLLILLIDLKIDICISKLDIQIMFSLFYVLMFMGCVGLYYGFKKFIHK